MAHLWSAQHIRVVAVTPTGRMVQLVDKPYARIGRDAGCEVMLPDPGVAPCHVYLHAADAKLYAMTTAAARHGAKPWHGVLRPGRVVKLGQSRLRAELAGGARHHDTTLERPCDVWPRLVIQAADGSQRDYQLLRRLTVVRGSAAPGRAARAAAECVLYWANNVLWAIDVRGSAHVVLDDVPLRVAKFRVGQTLTIGRLRLLYEGNARADTRDERSAFGVLDDAHPSLPQVPAMYLPQRGGEKTLADPRLPGHLKRAIAELASARAAYEVEAERLRGELAEFAGSKVELAQCCEGVQQNLSSQGQVIERLRQEIIVIRAQAESVAAVVDEPGAMFTAAVPESMPPSASVHDTAREPLEIIPCAAATPRDSETTNATAAESNVVTPPQEHPPAPERDESRPEVSTPGRSEELDNLTARLANQLIRFQRARRRRRLLMAFFVGTVAVLTGLSLWLWW